jgi:hypothetical protein
LLGDSGEGLAGVPKGRRGLGFSPGELDGAQVQQQHPPQKKKKSREGATHTEGAGEPPQPSGSPSAVRSASKISATTVRCPGGDLHDSC